MFPDRENRTQLERKNIRLEAANYVGKRQYFVTLCCAERQPLLATSNIASWATDRLHQSAAQHAFMIHAYCVMPDHLHLLAEGAKSTSNLLTFVAAYKQTTGFYFQAERGQNLWQQKYYDHILRKADALEPVAWYIWLNPVRKGLCQEPQEYCHSGSFTMAGRRLLLGSKGEQWSPPWRRTSLCM